MWDCLDGYKSSFLPESSAEIVWSCTADEGLCPMWTRTPKCTFSLAGRFMQQTGLKQQRSHKNKESSLFEVTSDARRRGDAWRGPPGGIQSSPSGQVWSVTGRTVVKKIKGQRCIQNLFLLPPSGQKSVTAKLIDPASLFKVYLFLLWFLSIVGKIAAISKYH